MFCVISSLCCTLHTLFGWPCSAVESITANIYIYDGCVICFMHGQTHGAILFRDSQTHINKRTLKHIWAGASLGIRSYWSAKEPVRPDQSSWQAIESGFQSMFVCFFERWLAGIEQGCKRGSALTPVKVWQAHTYTHTHTLSMCLIVISIQPTHSLLSLRHGTIVYVCVCLCLRTYPPLSNARVQAHGLSSGSHMRHFRP